MRENPHGAVALLQSITDDGRKPTAAAFLRVIEICTRAREPELAERVLNTFEPATRTYERPADVDRSARTSIALALLSIGAPRDALRVLRFDEAGPLRARLAAMQLGQDEVAWGCVVRALTADGEPMAAVEAARSAVAGGVLPSDSLTFFVLEAFRKCGRWRDAGDTFDAALAAGVVPHERTVGSLLRTLTAPPVRRFVDPERIVKLAHLPKEPSTRFCTVALIALASIGQVDAARKMHDVLVRAAAPNPPDERASSIFIGAYASLVEPGAPHDIVDVTSWHARICEEVDEQWALFSSHFSDASASERGSAARRKREARSRAFQRYLWTKARCLRVAEAATSLEHALSDAQTRAALDICTAHFAAVLSGAELTCDAAVLERVLRLMHREHLAHDPLRSLSPSVHCLDTVIRTVPSHSCVRMVRPSATRLHLPDSATTASRSSYADWTSSQTLRATRYATAPSIASLSR
eukprot:IDg17645t1